LVEHREVKRGHLTGHIFAGFDNRATPADWRTARTNTRSRHRHPQQKQVKLNGGGIGRCAKDPPITVNVGSF